MAATGVWVAFDPEKVKTPIIESAAESALWQAVENGMKVVFWSFGSSLDEAIAAAVTKAKPVAKASGVVKRASSKSTTAEPAPTEERK